jgi:hypothetical protein
VTAVFLVAQYARYEIRRMEAVSNFSFLYNSNIVFCQIFFFLVIFSLFIRGMLIDLFFFFLLALLSFFAASRILLLCMEFTLKKLRILSAEY